MRTLKIPVISGKDSLSSTYKNNDGLVIKIPPVLCISVFGKIPDIKRTCSSDLKKNNSTLVLVGKMDFDNMGGSAYYDINKVANNEIPKIDLNILPKVLNAIHRAINSKKLLSCHDISEGGILTSIFEMCVGGNMGAHLDISNIKSRADSALFNETSGCFMVEVENKKDIKKMFASIPYIVLGQTKKENILTVKNKGKTLISEKIDKLKNIWQKPMKKIFY
jgi:phosphoribosylformylglycinamidine synthase